MPASPPEPRPFPGPHASREEVAAWHLENDYDREIAPQLAEVMRLCDAHGMSIVASVEFAPGKRGSSIHEKPGAGLAQQTVRWATMANGNVDVLIGAICAYAQKHGHSSVFLNLLGVPLVPAKSAPGKEVSDAR